MKPPKVTKDKKETRGRPSDFTEQFKKAVELLYCEGFTFKKIAQVIGVTEQTIFNWKNENPVFFENLKDSKLVADKSVERSLYKKATGFSYTDSKGNEKYFPPDTGAICFWLKNRQPDLWKDKVEISATKGLAFNLILSGQPLMKQVEGEVQDAEFEQIEHDTEDESD